MTSRPRRRRQKGEKWMENKEKLEKLLLDAIENAVNGPLTENSLQEVSAMAHELIELWKFIG